MTILYITELPDIGYGGNSHSVSIVAEPAVAEQVITTSASSQQSSAFQNNTRFVRLETDVGNVNVKFGTNPTAVAGTSARLPQGVDRIQAVPMGGGFKVAVINAPA